LLEGLGLFAIAVDGVSAEVVSQGAGDGEPIGGALVLSGLVGLAFEGFGGGEAHRDGIPSAWLDVWVRVASQMAKAAQRRPATK